MNKWGLIGKAAVITAILLVVRLAFDYLNLNVLTLTNLVTAFITGAIFTVGIILAGVLTDYKESEKIPGEIAVAIRGMNSDLRLVHVADKEIVPRMQTKICNLLVTINTNFRNNTWDLAAMDTAIGTIVEDLSRLSIMDVPPHYIVKLKGGIGEIDKLSHRIKTIAETSFIPAAYAISEIATVGVVLLLLFVNLEPVYEGLGLFALIVLMMTSLLLLIRDMDNPFEVGKNSCADVDLFLLMDLERKLLERQGKYPASPENCGKTMP
jgi:hypothetical protein